MNELTRNLASRRDMQIELRREWLARPLGEAVPMIKVGDHLYWEQEGFVDLGPAIPDDPNYQGANVR